MVSRQTLAWSLLVLGLAGCSNEDTASIECHGIAGGRHTPQRVAAGQVHVIVFTSQECPIANAYAPTIAGLAAEWVDQPVRLYLVHVDPDLSSEAARTHAREFGLPGTILLDPKHRLATALGVKRTPEAVVLTQTEVVYRGRIDDQWYELGGRKEAATTQDLRDAVATARRGGKVPPPHPEAVGCLLPEPAR